MLTYPRDAFRGQSIKVTKLGYADSYSKITFYMNINLVFVNIIQLLLL